MARLDLYRGGRRVKSLTLHPARDWLVGRDPAADVVLQDSLASRRHFRVRHAESTGGLRLEDLDTPNGTVVNGIREYSRPLPSACTLQVGAEVLVFDPDADDGAEPEDTMPDWAIAILGDEDGDAPSTCHMPPARLRAMQATERARTRPHLVLANGTADAEVHALDHAVTAVGLGKVQVPLGALARGASRVLAEVELRGERYVVRAVGLFSRIKVNGVAVRRARLEPGDLIEVQGRRLQFFPGLAGGERRAG